MIKWHGSVQVGDWLRGIHEQRRLRPPQEVGVYVVSLNDWSARPTCGCHPLYVGGQTSTNSSLRRRMGQWVCEGFGFFIEDEQGIPTDGYHCGAQTLFKWCCEHSKSLLDLHIGWSSDGCFRCLENSIYDELKPSGMLLNKKRPGRCSLKH